MFVKASPGNQCPRMDPRMPPINDREAVTVPDVAYYRRRIADGSLTRVPAVEADLKIAPARSLSDAEAQAPKKNGKEKA